MEANINGANVIEGALMRSQQEYKEKEIAVAILEVLSDHKTSVAQAISALHRAEHMITQERINLQYNHAAYLEMTKGTDEEIQKIDELTVMGINSKTFEATMLLLHDLSAWFHGERYTMTIEVKPDGVFVKKYPKG